MHEYNTYDDNLVLREYGRNIHKLVKFLRTVEDREKRNNYAHALVELMKQINPSVKDANETDQRLWDDIYIMSGFDLDLDSPYPMPSPDILTRKPDPLPYAVNSIRFKHYGHNINLLIEEAKKIEDKDKKHYAYIYVGRLMKSFFSSWNKDNIDDSVIYDNINVLSGGDFDLDLEVIKENNLFETIYRDRPDTGGRSSGGGGKRGKRSSGGHHGKRRRNN